MLPVPSSLIKIITPLPNNTFTILPQLQYNGVQSVALRPTATASLRNLLEMYILITTIHVLESETVGGGSQQPVF